MFNNSDEVELVNAIIDEAGYSRINFGPTLVLKVNEAIKVNLVGGLAIGRRLEFIDAAEEILDRTPENGPFVKVGISFAPPGKKPEALFEK
ncbi:MAG: hypothetical protein AAFN81_22490 [Bacteroidota bacterium]